MKYLTDLVKYLRTCEIRLQYKLLTNYLLYTVELRRVPATPCIIKCADDTITVGNCTKINNLVLHSNHIACVVIPSCPNTHTHTKSCLNTSHPTYTSNILCYVYCNAMSSVFTWHAYDSHMTIKTGSSKSNLFITCFISANISRVLAHKSAHTTTSLAWLISSTAQR